MITHTRCSICRAEVYRDKNGRVLRHTRTEHDGLKLIPVICEGSDLGARA